ncbi:hypothetical protein JD844_001305 [Phrynosoma platyrhinos]|uniref:Coiled-coil domain-containing protein 189 n=1 Tax=Phrynosoma platyrhinos TaxID=52577 RepID=A0ABQ7TAY6_PHRPL|nr:hypothetical protein JD844_001305 [Phrynosoma platyrhinos]
MEEAAVAVATGESFTPPPQNPAMGPESLKKELVATVAGKYLDVHCMDLINQTETTDSLKRCSNWKREEIWFSRCLKRKVHIILGASPRKETPLPNVEECYNYFTELVFCHSIRRPPFSIDLFNQDQLVLITDYMINTYFRHYKLYKYAFTPQVRLDISFTYIGMPEPEPKDEETVAEITEAGLSPLPEEPEETAVREESPTAALREYIATQLNQELSQLRLSVEQRLKTTEEQFNAKLVQLEKSSNAGKGSAKGKKK